MRVLEVGTGSGYQTLVLSKMAKFVYTIERYKTLHQKAKELLKIIKAKSSVKTSYPTFIKNISQFSN